MNKNPLIAFFLAFIPGVGHFYLRRTVRSILYAFGFFTPIMIGISLAFVTRDDGPLVISVLSLLVWMISMIDIVITLIRNRQGLGTDHLVAGQEGEQLTANRSDSSQENERFYTILLSILPGLGHFQLGLMNRGLTFLIGFFGLLTMVGFVSILTQKGEFIVFLGGVPIIWIYSFFDAIQQLNRKQRGEELVDRNILEDLEQNREEGKKSKVIATLLSIFPGAGHLYLGLQRRGLQLMVAFLFAIYILDVLRISLFLFLIPILWFYSFFDALQQASRHGKEELKDVPIIDWLINHQKWIGIGLVVMGGFYLLDNVLMAIIQQLFPNINVYYWFQRYFQTTLVSILLIGGGLKLLLGGRGKNRSEKL